MKIGIKRPSFWLFPIIGIAFILVSCSADQSNLTPTNVTGEALPVATSTKVLPKNSATLIEANSTASTTFATDTYNISTTPLLSITKLPSSTNTLVALHGDEMYRWLKSIPCGPPCWEGITPGITTAQEAIEILKQNSLIEPDSVNDNDDLYPRQGSIIWKGVKNSKLLRGQAIYKPSSPKHVLDSIILNYDGVFTLREVVQAFGNPDYVFASQSTGIDTPCCYYEVTFAYIHKGFNLTGTNGIHQKPQLSLDMALKDLTFFVPNSSLNVAGRTDADNVAQVWQGIKDFDFYCRVPYYPKKVCT